MGMWKINPVDLENSPSGKSDYFLSPWFQNPNTTNFLLVIIIVILFLLLSPYCLSPVQISAHFSKCKTTQNICFGLMRTFMHFIVFFPQCSGIFLLMSLQRSSRTVQKELHKNFLIARRRECECKWRRQPPSPSPQRHGGADYGLGLFKKKNLFVKK